MFKKLIIYTDGGARGNPGPAGIGAVLYNGKKEKIFEISECIGEATNNQAEYKAVVAAIKKAKDYKPEEIIFYLDSELVVKQLKREYKLKNLELQPLFIKIYNETLAYKKVDFIHIPREQNKEADKLVNKALDEAGF